jgi:hypothetical protein
LLLVVSCHDVSASLAVAALDADVGPHLNLKANGVVGHLTHCEEMEDASSTKSANKDDSTNSNINHGTQELSYPTMV